MKKKKVIISSAISILAFAGISIGGTYALFTSSSDANIAITAGNVDVTASIGDLTLYTPKLINSDGTLEDATNIAYVESDVNYFGNGGTATISGDTLSITNVVPGDKLTTTIDFTNNSNIEIKYRVISECVSTDYTLYQGLDYTLGTKAMKTIKKGYTSWTIVEAGESIDSIDISIELPTTAGNDYQNLTADIKLTVEAVQGNAYTVDDEDVPFVSANYLKFTATAANSSVTPKFAAGTYQYSTNNGSSWTTGTNDGTTTINLNSVNDSVILKGEDCVTHDDNDNNVSFLMTGEISASGSVTSITDGVGIDPQVELEMGCYFQMFAGCTSLTTAPSLPSLNLAMYCYADMFAGCDSLTTAPSLPANNLVEGCYSEMFYECTSLDVVPSLPASTLADDCYNAMFSSCSSLTTAPTLSAMVLAESCYTSMFADCISLTTAPSLPATTLEANCYSSMFAGCTSLTTAPNLIATNLAKSCYRCMFEECTSLTIAPTISGVTPAMMCCMRMFYGCTSLLAAPTLNFTTSDQYSFSYMFYNCTNLTTPADISAITNYTLASCSHMYMNCTSLNINKTGSGTLFFTATTTEAGSAAYQDMFTNVPGITGEPAAGESYYFTVAE